MKILEVVDLDPNKFGSFEKYCLGFGEYLRAKGHQHFVFFKGKPCSMLQDELKKVKGSFLNQHFHRLGISDTFLLIQYILKNKIDVVHLHFYPAYSFFSFVSAFFSYKVIYSYHLSGEFSNNKLWKRALKIARGKFFGLGIDGVFCVSDFARKKFIHNYHADPEKTYVVYNGLNWDYFKPEKKAVSDAAENKFRVICVAALKKNKGVIDVIKAVQSVINKIPSIQLTIVGLGVDRAELELFVHTEGLEKNVCFLGLRDDVPSLLSASDVAVVPSRWGEAFGFTVIEAMAAGLPVIATSVGGIPEIIDHEKTGLLVHKAEPDEISDALIRLYNDEELQYSIGKQACRRVKNYFNVKRVYEEQLDFYMSLN